MKKLAIKYLSILVVFLYFPSSLYGWDVRANFDVEEQKLYIGGAEMGWADLKRRDKTGVDQKISCIYFKSQKKDVIVQSDMWFRKIALSPDKKFVSALQGVNVKKELFHLVIFNKSGKTIEEIKKGIIEYRWSPDGNFLAYIVGSYIPYAMEPYRFVPEGVYIYDLEKKVERKIADRAFDLEWAEFDRNLYFDKAGPVYRKNDRGGWILDRTKEQKWVIEREIYRYNIKTKSVERTSYKGLFFSPDGKYYFNLPLAMPAGGDPPGDGNIIMYSRHDNKDLRVNTSCGAGHVYWCKNSRHLIARENGICVFDPQKREINMVRKISFPAKIVGYDHDCKTIITYNVGEMPFFKVEDFLTGKKIAEYSDTK